MVLKVEALPTHLTFSHVLYLWFFFEKKLRVTHGLPGCPLSSAQVYYIFGLYTWNCVFDFPTVVFFKTVTRSIFLTYGCCLKFRHFIEFKTTSFLHRVFADGGQEKRLEESKNECISENGEKKDGGAAEPKSAKKKKKKDKASKESKETQDQPNNTPEVNVEPTESAEHAEEDETSVDVKERLKKLAASRKKKSSKEMAPVKAAASEAAARSAKLAAAKKKEKNHYNQQPVR